MVERPKSSTGEVTATDQVIVTDTALATVVALAAHEVPGVVGMAPASIREGLNRILGSSRLDEGVEVQRESEEDDTANIRIHIVVAYGVNIPVVADSVRERVQYAARTFAGVNVKDVNVNVAGVSRA